MTQKLSSYAAGSWYAAADDGTPILDSSTGEVVATVSASGLDVAAMVEHARTVGGPALRALTFQQRGLMLKELGKYLTGRAGEIHANYGAAGATTPDAQVDVEGGIGVLFVYGSKARRELPDDTIYTDGGIEPLGKDPNFVGQTIYSSRPGVAVFINAFNFPVWGMLEKLAPTLLAGLPVIVKPATATAQLAEQAFRQIIESGILPEGSVQFIAGGVGDLLDHLGGNDVIAFTGSASTAAKLRSGPAVVERSATFNGEADSLNASILGPDGGPDTEEFAQFIKTVAREVTSKTGQKCTAIRRALVPEPLLDKVIDALTARLGKVVVGDPRDPATRMGPLVSVAQRDEVAGAVRRLAQGADILLGGPDAELTLGSGDPAKGAFFPPTVLLARDRRDRNLHTIEAFGPVTTLFPYTDAAEAAELVALGEGSLVASVVSNDQQFVRDLVREIAPFHGRLLLLDRDSAAAATPHGAVLPNLIHGGPGRAGGGAELGGIRGVLHLMQATSLSGSPALIAAATGRWNANAPEVDPGVHPFRKYYEQLQIGDTFHTGTREITLADIETFAHFTGDTFYAHMDDQAAAANPLFEGRVAHGYFVLAAAAGLFVDPDPGPVLANFGLDRLRFVKPVYPGDVISVRLTCKAKTIRGGIDQGEVTWDVGVTNSDGELVAAYDLLTINALESAAG
ncbi:phenylacetic acid degradation bifunctional protein PaaZ [Nakamurella lactea]|uniref:phenylacetic acid degradation bifunctional protein PaaZ n=1 Tax=Nakamurella lactea TaxID=459515 RepID=UPI000422CE73|nr:phenylacetic acid degradation bifunctional protein PaaZ [Nakamurella lactea]